MTEYSEKVIKRAKEIAAGVEIRPSQVSGKQLIDKWEQFNEL